MIALPFCQSVRVRLHAAKPEHLPLCGGSLGAQLRRRRRELGLRRVDAAPLLGVAQETLGNWERERTEPEDRLYPAIIQYLGREPWNNSASLPEALVAERRRRGLSIAAASIAIGIDEGTLGRWESGEWKPQPRSRPKIEQFLCLRMGTLKDNF